MNVRKKQIRNLLKHRKRQGNYKMGHVSFSDLRKYLLKTPPKGSKRYWKDDKGNEPYNVMKKSLWIFF